MASDPGPSRALLNRVIGQLDLLQDGVSAQEFGRTLQRLLGLAFELAGCSVTENPVGVPDLQVETATGLCLAIEVKTGNPVTISRRDLDGVQGHGQKGALAVLVFPDVHPRWCLADAATLSPGRFAVRQLLRAPQIDTGVDVQTAFLAVVDSVPSEALPSRTALADWADVQRRLAWPLRAS